MEKYLEKIAELLEEENVNLDDNITLFDGWDSLTSLSIIAYVDEEFHVNISAKDIIEAKTIGGLYELISSKK